MKFSVNVDFVYDGIDYIKAIHEIKEVGFENIEICFMQDKKIEELEKIQNELGIGVELMLSEFVNLTEASKKDAFILAMKSKLEEASRLSCKKIIVAVGDDIESITHEEQLKNIETGVVEMIPMFEQADCTMLIEPINIKVDHPEAGLWSSKESFDMVRRINSPRVKMLYDIYHMQVMEGDVTRTILDNLDLIEHLHCAGNPGRNEIYHGEINYPEILNAVEKAGFNGCVGIEYAPTEEPKSSLIKTLELLKNIY